MLTPIAAFALAVAARFAEAESAAVISAEVRKTAESLREKAFAGTRAAEWARGLTDQAGARLPASPGDRASIEWGLATLKTLGFANVRAEKVRTNTWQRGVETGEVTAPYPQKLFLTALGGSA
jgi:hypothetical protein